MTITVLLIYVANFIVTVNAVCGVRYFSPFTGQITSPNYPMPYNNSVDCYNYITVPTGQKVTITFQAFNTETRYDWVKISCSTGSSFTSPQYNGSQIPPAMAITSCSLVNVSFHADESNVDTGFSLTYIIAPDCGDRYFNGLTGQISSPNYPTLYSNNLDCNIFITVPPQQTVTITFQALNTQPSFDIVLIACVSGNIFTSSQYSGATIPAVLTITSCTNVNVYFHTDASIINIGFSLTYNITPDCANPYFYELNGQISSPNYPMAYTNNLDCSNYIRIPSGQTLTITFLAFNTQPSVDWVTITCETGDVFRSPRYWGVAFPSILTISSCSLVNVYFHTDSFSTYTGFSLTYNITSGNVTGGITTMPSNAFPRLDKNDRVILNCTTASKYLPWWTIHAMNSGNYTITNSTCGMITSAPYSYLFMTESLGRGSCNLIVVAPAYLRYLLVGSVVCTDSTLSSARAILAPINLELSFTKGENFSAPVTDIVRDEKMRISCIPSFNYWSTSPLEFTYFLYSGGPSVQIRMLSTYWTSQGTIVSSSSIDTSNTSSYVVVKAPEGSVPPYTCNIVCYFFSNISDLSGESSIKISYSTEPIKVLYWPTEDNMRITGDGNGQIHTPALLGCDVAANPPANYTWIDESNGNVTDGPTVVVNHGGKYTCNASNVIRGQFYQQSKSVDLKVLEEQKITAIILGVLLGAAILTIIILSVILLIRKCSQTKRNSDLGNINNHELRQRSVENNRYEAPIGNAVDTASTEYENLDRLRRPDSMYPTVYEELAQQK